MLRTDDKISIKLRSCACFFFFSLVTSLLPFIANISYPDRQSVLYPLLALLISAVLSGVFAARILRQSVMSDNLFGAYILSFLLSCPFMPLSANIRNNSVGYIYLPFALFCLFCVLLREKLCIAALLCSLPFTLSAFANGDIPHTLYLQRFLYLPVMFSALLCFTFIVSKTKLSKIVFGSFVLINLSLLIVTSLLSKDGSSQRLIYSANLVAAELLYAVPGILTVFLILKSVFKSSREQKLFSVWFINTLCGVILSLFTASCFIPYGLSVILMSQLIFILVLWHEKGRELNSVISSRPGLYIALLVVNSIPGFTKLFY